MTNNREEQIYKAADKATYQKPPQYSELVHKSRKVMCAYEVGFIDGCVWADSHPAWVSVEDELPKERGHYLAYTEYGQVWLTEYMQDKGGYWDWFVAPICVGAVSKVTHWMPLPTPPVKKGGEQ